MILSRILVIGSLSGIPFGIAVASAFGPIPKKDQCISVNALLNRNCAPVYMCNGTAETNADWCCSTTQRWFSEEQRLKRWYRRNCKNG